jgi:hypothetical protein
MTDSSLKGYVSLTAIVVHVQIVLIATVIALTVEVMDATVIVIAIELAKKSHYEYFCVNF